MCSLKMKDKRELLRLKRHKTLRLRIFGTEDKPRLVVHRSLKNLHAQIVDDTKKQTLISLSTVDKEIKQNCTFAGNIKAATYLGEVFSSKVKAKGITKIVFDRAGYLYHGRIKAFAEALRKGGLEF
jgi:large subunit ribosomal protein L18